ncbi:MAG: polysaccharide deacetylase family protein [Verrucomicrobiales bacterium]|nr:polysaccharide deacetylase family protein [Verrucomicrobiales bacterium]
MQHSVFAMQARGEYAQVVKSVILSLVALLIFGTAAYSEDLPAPLKSGGVVLTFDDRNFDDWLAAIPLFEKYHANATFFISGAIDEKAIATALELKQHGHAIGSHSVHHLSAIKYLEDHTAADFVKNEIEPQMIAFRAAGITPTAFAYPMSRNHPETDKELLKIFRHLRTGKGIDSQRGIIDYDEFFVPVEKIKETGLLFGKGIDFAPVRDDRSFEKIDAALTRAAQNREILTLYAHQITPIGKGNFITPSALEHVLKKAKALNLPFFTVDQLP